MKVNFHFSPNLKCQITERLIVIFPLKRERGRGGIEPTSKQREEILFCKCERPYSRSRNLQGTLPKRM